MTAKFFFHVGFMVCAFGIVTLLGCGGTPKQDIFVTLNSTEELNPDPDGTPHSVVVRVYTLKDDDRFKKATFTDLWKRDRDTLGRDLLTWEEVTVHPGSEYPLEFEVELKEDQGFLGVVAFFLEYQGKAWRQILPLEDPFLPFSDQKIFIILDHHSVQVSHPE